MSDCIYMNFVNTIKLDLYRCIHFLLALTICQHRHLGWTSYRLKEIYSFAMVSGFGTSIGLLCGYLVLFLLLRIESLKDKDPSSCFHLLGFGWQGLLVSLLLLMNRALCFIVYNTLNIFFTESLERNREKLNNLWLIYWKPYNHNHALIVILLFFCTVKYFLKFLIFPQ